jgi:hypothetical protein
VSRLPPGAWIMTARGWRQMPGPPQVVFVPDRRIDGPVDWAGWLHTGGRLAPPREPSGVDLDGYDWPETLGGDE